MITTNTKKEYTAPETQLVAVKMEMSIASPTGEQFDLPEEYGGLF